METKFENKPHDNDEIINAMSKTLFKIGLLMRVFIMRGLKSMFDEGINEPYCIVFNLESTLCLAFASSGDKLKRVLAIVAKNEPFIIEGAKDFACLKKNGLNLKLENIVEDVVANMLVDQIVDHFGLVNHPDIKVFGLDPESSNAKPILRINELKY